MGIGVGDFEPAASQAVTEINFGPTDILGAERIDNHFDTLTAHDKVVRAMTGGVRALMKTNKVTTFEGMGAITAPGKVSVKSSAGEMQEIETKNILIATGNPGK